MGPTQGQSWVKRACFTHLRGSPRGHPRGDPGKMLTAARYVREVCRPWDTVRTNSHIFFSFTRETSDKRIPRDTSVGSARRLIACLHDRRTCRAMRENAAPTSRGSSAAKPSHTESSFSFSPKSDSQRNTGLFDLSFFFFFPPAGGVPTLNEHALCTDN